MESPKCKAYTSSGKHCKLKANDSGYCHIHDPIKKVEREQNRKRAEEQRQKSWKAGRRLREVVDFIKQIVNAKGWHSYTAYMDEDSWKHGTIKINSSNLYGDFFDNRQVTASLEVSIIKDNINLSYIPTSTYKNGLSQLFGVIEKEIYSLPWMLNNNSTQTSKSEKDIQVNKIINLLKRFPKVVQQLKRRYSDRQTIIINDEYDVQDLLHSLLKIEFDDVRQEEVSPSYAGASSRFDFLIKEYGIGIEVKKTSKKLRDKLIGEQLIIDIERYKSHPDCKILICFIYDPEQLLSNPNGLKNDINRNDDKMEVLLIISPE